MNYLGFSQMSKKKKVLTFVIALYYKTDAYKLYLISVFYNIGFTLLFSRDTIVIVYKLCIHCEYFYE